MRFAALAVLLVFTVGAACASAAFVNGREAFDGTVMDTANWQLFNNGAATFTQNDTLRIQSNTLQNFGQGDYTSLQATVGVGGSVQVDVTVHATRFADILHAIADDVNLELTSNSGGAASSMLFDDYQLLTQVSYESDNNEVSFFGEFLHGGSGGGNGQVFGFPGFSHVYTLEIDRLSSTSVRHAVWFDGTLAFQLTRTVPANTAPLLVGLYGVNTDAEFDNVQLSGNFVPEPSSAALGLIASVAALARRRRRCNA